MNLAIAARELAEFLKESGVLYAIAGGFALQYWGEPRLTRDLDVTVLVPQEQLPGFLDFALKRFRPRLPDAKDFALKHRVLLVETEAGVPIDVSLGIPGYEEEALKRAVIRDVPEAGRLPLLSAEDLIIHKCVAGRARDMEDVLGILLRQRLKLDLDLIRHWLKEFQPAVETHDPLECFEALLREAEKAAGGEMPSA